MTQTVKNLHAMQETWVQSLGWEDPLEEGMATHSSTLAWEIPWIEEPGRLLGVAKNRTQLTDSHFLFFFFFKYVHNLLFLSVWFFRFCCCLVTKSCLTLCDPMDGSPPASFVWRILQARILEWVAIPSSRGSS